jgi:hypothetical protein
MAKTPGNSWFEKRVSRLTRRQKIRILCLASVILVAITANNYLAQHGLIKEPLIILMPLQIIFVLFNATYAFWLFRKIFAVPPPSPRRRTSSPQR